MDVGEEPGEPATPVQKSKENPEFPVKTEPMEEEPSEKPHVEPITFEETSVKSEVKPEPLDITPKEEPMEATAEGDEQKTQDTSETPEVKVEPPEDKIEEEGNTSLGNLTADAGQLDAPSFPSVGIKVNITSQVFANFLIARKICTILLNKLGVNFSKNITF